MDATIAIAALALVGTLANAWFTYKKGAKKDEVEALRGIIQELKDYIEEKEQDIEDLQAWAEKLVCQVKDAGLEPAHFRRTLRKAQK